MAAALVLAMPGGVRADEAASTELPRCEPATLGAHRLHGQLAEEGNQGRRDMGREAFIERVWNWKGESGGTIINQLRRLGASCDWSRERFTMDEGLSKAVLKVFVQLYNEGLIYKDKRLVNWDPKLETAISDLEVVPTDVNGLTARRSLCLRQPTGHPSSPARHPSYPD